MRRHRPLPHVLRPHRRPPRAHRHLAATSSTGGIDHVRRVVLEDAPRHRRRPRGRHGPPRRRLRVRVEGHPGRPRAPGPVPLASSTPTSPTPTSPTCGCGARGSPHDAPSSVTRRADRAGPTSRPVAALTPDRGVAVLVDGRQVAVFLLGDGALHAIDNHDPISRRQRAEPGHRRRPRRRAGRGVARSTSSASSSATGRCLDDPEHAVADPRRRGSATAGSTCASGDGHRAAARRRRRAAAADQPPAPVVAPGGDRPELLAARRRRAVPLRLRHGGLRRLPLLRGGLRRAERAARRGPPGGGSARSRAATFPDTTPVPPVDVVQPLPRAGLPRGLPDQRLREARQRRRGPPGRRVHRLPVLHLELPVLGAGLPARPAHRHEVRHVPAPPRGRAGRRPASTPARRIAITVEKVERRGLAGRPLAPATRRNCPSSDLTLSTTRIELPDDVPVETYGGSDWALRPEHPHWPLVWLTLLTQAAVGASAHRRRPAEPADRRRAGAWRRWRASLLHLGRPVHAWKALRNLRRSWLSPGGGAVRRLRRRWPRWPSSCPAAAPVAAVVGAAGVYASGRLYMVPGRPAWHSPLTIVRFGATALALGPLAHRAPGRRRWSASAVPGARHGRQPRSGWPAGDRIEWWGAVRLDARWFRPCADRRRRCAGWPGGARRRRLGPLVLAARSCSPAPS